MKSPHDKVLAALRKYTGLHKPERIQSVLRKEPGIWEAKGADGKVIAFFGDNFMELLAGLPPSFFREQRGQKGVIRKPCGAPRSHKVKRNVSKRQQKF